MGLLTTDEPKTNVERLNNFIYAKDGQIYVRRFNGKKDMNINEIVRNVAQYGDNTTILDNIADDDIFETLIHLGDGYYSTILLVSATQAAEMRGQLKEYENIGLTPKKIKDLHAKVVDLELKLQGHDRDLFDGRESVIDEIVDYLRELGFTEASMAVEEYREL
ncbi:MAG: hypothetical protein HFE51_04890 [Clostridia bacterium]|nr:hypothetical protein [Clostridia bacterium]